MKTIKSFGIFLIAITFFSCEKDLIVDTSIEGDYNLFFEYLENDYSYRDAFPFTMEELKLKYLPQIKASNDQTTLATALVSVENELKDHHFRFQENVYNLSSIPKYSSDSLEKITPTFAEVTISDTTAFYIYGTITSNPDIGYIYIKAFKTPDSGLGIPEGVKEINNIIKEMNDEKVTSMIVDIRSGAGGSNYIPRYIAQRFMNRTAIYMLEYYPEGESFIRKEWEVAPEGEIGFRTGKVALLSNGQTASGGEMFLLAMLQRDNLVHIGSRSVGVAGNIATKDLSNGWNFSLTNSRTEHPDGKQYFHVGIIPSIIVANDTNYSVTYNNDKLIEKAIEELQ